MQKRVTTIPATISKFNKKPISEIKKRKVAGYARVSTDKDEQQSSYDAQLDYYTNYIKSRDDWEFVKVYTDEGISGTNTKKRAGFNKMIKDAMNGKIDLIVTKSVSRFARNTVDSLTTVRKLKEKGIEIYFEKENIWTLDSKGELLITIMSSLAQEESRSISENVKWGKRKGFSDGKVTVAYKNLLGYKKGENGELAIDEEQAKVVRKIYALFLKGYSERAIAKKLEEEGIKTVYGKSKWYSNIIHSVLTNEKYKGDALLQKYYTVDFLSKKQQRNNGEIQQYYVKNNHEAIIKPSTFDRVQRMIEQRKKLNIRTSRISIFSSRLICGSCQSYYGPKVWHSNDKYRRTIWQCNCKFDKKCKTPHLTEDEIKEVFINAANQLFENKGELIKTHKEITKELFKTDVLEEKQAKLENEISIISELINEEIGKNSRFAQDQEEYERKYNDLVKRFETAKAKLDDVVEKIIDKNSKYDLINEFIEKLEGQDIITEFNEDLWCSLVESLTIHSKKEILVVFQDGTKIKTEL
ncbi:recombinase family protein [Ligilactobacillus ceti]|uniref:Resolvase, N-terminal domain protein n=1 Tax=Ligilactobacillus ceti DSM 22408 TaxID=1122146 RepID=A0A0R2KMR3_9LACO|nr:recombinase family protein [Ligilactobacillus ceti]KRN88741.1 resolvase, N-terminal domain protein [Ligilactobacillus ceti DSM 22408]